MSNSRSAFSVRRSALYSVMALLFCGGAGGKGCEVNPAADTAAIAGAVALPAAAAVAPGLVPSLVLQPALVLGLALLLLPLALFLQLRLLGLARKGQFPTAAPAAIAPPLAGHGERPQIQIS